VCLPGHDTDAGQPQRLWDYFECTLNELSDVARLGFDRRIFHVFDRHFHVISVDAAIAVDDGIVHASEAPGDGAGTTGPDCDQRAAGSRGEEVTMNSSVRILLASGLLAITATLGTGCQRGGRSLLPDPPTDQPRLSSYEPTNPYRQLAPGLLSRKIFDAPAAAADAAVEVLDLLIAPGQGATDVRLLGGAVFEVRAGSGVLTTGGKRQDVKTGSTFAVPQGTSFTVENTGELPITLRVFVITAR